jgi:hypothetical protein
MNSVWKIIGNCQLDLQEDIKKRLALFRKYKGIRRSRQIEEVLTSNTCFHRVGDVGVRSNTAGEDVLALTTGSTTLAMSPRPISGI